MSQIITYGLGGFDPSKPDNNVVSVTDIPESETVNDISVIAELLSSLPEDKLTALINALN